MLFGELGDALQCVFQEATLATGADHAHGDLAEHARMLPHGVGQGRTLFDLVVDVFQNSAQRDVRSLIAEDRDRSEQRHTATQQR